MNEDKDLVTSHMAFAIPPCSNCKKLKARIEQLEKLLRMTLECEDNHCDRCKEDIKRGLEGK